MTKFVICLFTVLVVLAEWACATTLLVPSQYATIQAGINAAVDGDTVLVAAGTYNENINFMGKEIVVKSDAPPEMTRIVAQSNWTYVVVMENGEGRGAVLEGFLITGNNSGYGGIGIFCNTGTAPTLRNNVIANNGNLWMAMAGGGITAMGSSPWIENNYIRSNLGAEGGGGISLSGCSNATIIGNMITLNDARSSGGVGQGGGIRASSSIALIEGNVISYNTAMDYGYGGGLFFAYGGTYEVYHNTLVGNAATSPAYPWAIAGGGISIGEELSCNAVIHFRDNIVVNSSGGGIAKNWGGTQALLDMDFNDVWNNQPSNYYGCAAGSADISADPLFEGGSPYSYELNAASPCIDAGSFTSDPDPDGTRSDIGAYSFDQAGMNVALIANRWPIQIPAAGGNFVCTLYLTNHTAAAIQFDVWVDVLLPDSSIFGPLILRQNLTFSAGQQVMRSIIQNVPPAAPAGNYFYRAYTGIYQTGQIYCETDMPFTKVGMEGADGKWTIAGDLAGWDAAALTSYPPKD